MSYWGLSKVGIDFPFPVVTLTRNWQQNWAVLIGAVTADGMLRSIVKTNQVPACWDDSLLVSERLHREPCFSKFNVRVTGPGNWLKYTFWFWASGKGLRLKSLTSVLQAPWWCQWDWSTACCKGPWTEASLMHSRMPAVFLYRLSFNSDKYLARWVIICAWRKRAEGDVLV